MNYLKMMKQNMDERLKEVDEQVLAKHNEIKKLIDGGGPSTNHTETEFKKDSEDTATKSWFNKTSFLEEQIAKQNAQLKNADLPSVKMSMNNIMSQFQFFIKKDDFDQNQNEVRKLRNIVDELKETVYNQKVQFSQLNEENTRHIKHQCDQDVESRNRLDTLET